MVTTQTHGARVGTAAGATDIAGPRAVLRHRGDSKGTGDCPWAGRRNYSIKVSGFDGPVPDYYVGISQFFRPSKVTHRVERLFRVLTRLETTRELRILVLFVSPPWLRTTVTLVFFALVLHSYTNVVPNRGPATWVCSTVGMDTARTSDIDGNALQGSRRD
jgi:hypothetical protein